MTDDAGARNLGTSGACATRRSSGRQLAKDLKRLEQRLRRAVAAGSLVLLGVGVAWTLGRAPGLTHSVVPPADARLIQESAALAQRLQHDETQAAELQHRLAGVPPAGATASPASVPVSLLPSAATPHTFTGAS